MATELVHENGDAPFNRVDQEQTYDETYDGLRAVRHSRWTKRETVILLEGKKLVENQMKDGHRSHTPTSVSDKLEPKWDSVASFCQRNGVSRGLAQCRKRWSNLLGDFRKIKSWESREDESFWTMRNDFKKEKKLPSSFDRDIFEIMDGKQLPIPLTIYQARSRTNNSDGYEAEEGKKEEAEEEDNDAVLDDNNQNATPRDGMFPEFGQHEKDEIKETLPSASPTNMKGAQFPSTGAEKVRSPSSNTWTGSSSQDGGRKRKRMPSEENNLEDQLIKVLEKNSNMLCAQLEAQNKYYHEDRNQQKEHTDRVVSAVNKLTQVLTKIADKLELIAGK